MNISQAAKHTGLSNKTIRYYESIGLVSSASREANGYRLYGEKQLKELGFVYHARELGFTLDECRELLTLYNDHTRKSADVKAIARSRIENINQRISQLQTMKNSLTKLVECCHGNDKPDCPILDGLSKSQSE